MSVKDKIKELKDRFQAPPDLDQLTENSFVYSATELGFIHPDTGSSIRLLDNGNVEMFAKDYSGIVLSSDGKSNNLYGDYINTYSNKMNINTDDNGFAWNYHVFNPDMSKVKLLVCDETIVKALNMLLNGGISIVGSCVAGPVTGQTLPAAPGMVQTIKPYMYDTKPEIVDSDVAQATQNAMKEAIADV